MAQSNLESIDESWDESASEPVGSESEGVTKEDVTSKAAASDDASAAATDTDVVIDATANATNASGDEPQASPVPATVSAEPETTAAPEPEPESEPEPLATQVSTPRTAAPARGGELFADLAPKRAREEDPARRPERLGEALELVRATRSGRSIPPPPSNARPPDPPPAAPVLAQPPPARSAPPPSPSARAASAPSLPSAPDPAALEMDEPTPPPKERSAPNAAAEPVPRSAPKSLPPQSSAQAAPPRSPLPAANPPASSSRQQLLPPASLPPLPKLPPLSSFAVPAEPPLPRRMPSLEPVVTPVPLLARPRARVAAAAVAVLALLGAIPVIVALTARGSGTLLATVAGPGNVPVDAVRLYVDGKLVCEGSPCRVEELARGTHFVRVAADGYQRTADRAIVVVGGEESVLNFALSRPAREPVARSSDTTADEPVSEEPRHEEVASEERPTRRTRSGAPRAPAGRATVARSTPAATSATLKISASSPTNIVLDGRPLGQTPKTLRVSPGRHTIMFAGEQGRRVQVVEVAAGESKAVAARF